MARALELESQRWAQDVAPQSLDGHCHSELAIDILQVPLTVPLSPMVHRDSHSFDGGGRPSELRPHAPTSSRALALSGAGSGVLCDAHPLLPADHFTRPDQGREHHFGHGDADKTVAAGGAGRATEEVGVSTHRGPSTGEPLALLALWVGNPS